MRAVRPKVSGHPRNARGDLELAHFSLVNFSIEFKSEGTLVLLHVMQILN